MGYARIAVRHTVVLMVCLRFGQGQFEFRLMMAFSITCHLYTSYTVWMLKSHGHLLVLLLMYWRMQLWKSTKTSKASAAQLPSA